MGGTYKATGINLKGAPMGESDRLVTVLTKEFGLIRAVVPGARKHQSSLRGLSGLFVVNQLLIAKGRSLDKIVQAESLESYPGLGQDLKKLTASQYLAELVLYQALSNQPQEGLFYLLREHLSRLEKLPSSVTLPCLTHAMFHLLALSGVAPQVHACCVTQQPLNPDFTDPNWRVGFSAAAGGTVNLSESEKLAAENLLSPHLEIKQLAQPHRSIPPEGRVSEKPGAIANRPVDAFHPGPMKPSTVRQRVPTQKGGLASKPSEWLTQLNATELALLQQLSQPDLIQPDGTISYPTEYSLFQPSEQVWLPIERVLRHYAQYHFERPIRSAVLIDTCFLSSVPASL